MKLKVEAGVRYWEDATVNGIKDVDGVLIPCKKGDLWCPIIDLDNGTIVNWERGKTAKVHYKVCDSGVYYILDENGDAILQWISDYVPNRFLCFGDTGCGDYIIMEINEDGKIINYVKPDIKEDEWG